MTAARHGEILANANPTATPGDEEPEDPAALIKMNHQHSKLGPAMPVRTHDGRRNLLCEPRLNPSYADYIACSARLTCGSKQPYDRADERHAARPLAERLAGAEAKPPPTYIAPCTERLMHRLL
eukprot:scaffold6818_cov60-Phaeocystis_antarctica.AAC.1